MQTCVIGRNRVRALNRASAPRAAVSGPKSAGAVAAVLTVTDGPTSTASGTTSTTWRRRRRRDELPTIWAATLRTRRAAATAPGGRDPGRPPDPHAPPATRVHVLSGTPVRALRRPARRATTGSRTRTWPTAPSNSPKTSSRRSARPGRSRGPCRRSLCHRPGSGSGGSAGAGPPAAVICTTLLLVLRQEGGNLATWRRPAAARSCSPRRTRARTRPRSRSPRTTRP